MDHNWRRCRAIRDFTCWKTGKPVRVPAGTVGELQARSGNYASVVWTAPVSAETTTHIDDIDFIGSDNDNR